MLRRSLLALLLLDWVRDCTSVRRSNTLPDRKEGEEGDVNKGRICVYKLSA